MDIFMETMDVNGCQRVMQAIKNHNPDFVAWGLWRLKQAGQGSQMLRRANKGIPAPFPVGEGHFFGYTAEEVSSSRSRVAGLVEKLETDAHVKISPSLARIPLWPPSSPQPIFGHKIHSIWQRTPRTSKKIRTDW